MAFSVAAKASTNVPDLLQDDFYEKFPFQQPSDIFNYIQFRKPDGGSDKMIQILDEFSSKYPMYKLSKEKAILLAKIVEDKKPKQVLEIGSFFGYSALYIATSMPAGSTLTCIEANPANAEVARYVFNAALSKDSLSSVQLLEGISSNVIQSDAFTSKYSEQIDFIFMDHDKETYLYDLKILENLNLLAPMCTIVADNVVFPGAPAFLDYVQTNQSKSRQYNTKLISVPFERIGFETNWKQVDDAMSVTTSVPI